MKQKTTRLKRLMARATEIMGRIPDGFCWIDAFGCLNASTKRQTVILSEQSDGSILVLSDLGAA